MLPKKRIRERGGIERAPKREWPRHRKFVRLHECCVPGCKTMTVEFAHLRSAANAGTGIKPHDIFGVSLCRFHHDEQHRIGADSFGRRHCIDLWELAREFTRRSPDQAMRDSLNPQREEGRDAAR